MNGLNHEAASPQPKPLEAVPEKEPCAGLLDSWKEIARYLARDIRTVQRWEKSENLPVHRHIHKERGSVYAFKAEIESWRTARASLPSQARVCKPIPKEQAGSFYECQPACQFGPQARYLQRVIWQPIDGKGQTILLYFAGSGFGATVLHCSGSAQSYSKETINGMDDSSA